MDRAPISSITGAIAYQADRLRRGAYAVLALVGVVVCCGPSAADDRPLLDRVVDACRAHENVVDVNLTLEDVGLRPLTKQDSSAYLMLRVKQTLHGIAADKAVDGLDQNEIAELQSLLDSETRLAPMKANLSARRLEPLGRAILLTDKVLVETGQDISAAGEDSPYCVIRSTETPAFDAYWDELEPAKETDWSVTRYDPDAIVSGGVRAATIYSVSPFETVFLAPFEPVFELYVTFQPALPAS